MQNNGDNIENSQELKKRTYKEIALENQQRREIDKLNYIDKTEQFISKKKKEKILSRFEDIPKEYKSKWDMVEKTDIFKKKEEDKKSILKPIVSNWDKPQNYNDSELKIQETPVTVHTSVKQKEVNFLQSLTKEQLELYQQELEIEKRNKYITDEELDDLLPREGFEIVEPPPNYKQIKISRNLNNSKNPFDSNEKEQNYSIPELKQAGEELPAMTQSDLKYFGSLLSAEKNRKLTNKETKERKVLTLLLKIKNGTSAIRKEALKEMTEKTKEFGAELLFNRIIPILMDSSLDQYERHLIIKVLNRIIYKLDEQIRPYLTKLLALVQPMLIEDDYFVRLEGRELISNISKAAGLSNFIMAIRTDLDNPNDGVRDVIAQAFAVGANALTIPSVIPFIKAVCRSKKSWEARHTGCKIVFHIAKLLGCGILPHLKSLVSSVENCLSDENKRVKIAAAISIASLAQACKPYGIEAFDAVLGKLWEGLKSSRGRAFASFLKAMGNLIPLMDEDHSKEYTKLIMNILLKEFETPEDEMKKIILQVIHNSIEKGGIEADFIREKMLEPFWDNFWTRRLCLNKGASFRLIEATVSIAGKIGVSEIIKKLTFNLKEDDETLRKITTITLKEIVEKYGVEDISLRLEELLVDAIIFAFYQQVDDEDNSVLNGFSSIIKGLGERSKKYLPQIVANICARSKIQNNRLRQQAADLVVNLAKIIYDCEEYKLLQTLYNVLYENLGEEYPEVLGSILEGIKSIIYVVGVTNINPPVSELLPSLTPILKNRHEKVQQNLVDLIGIIADKGGEDIEPREWIRICIDLLDLLKAPKKAIRKSAINTFGYIAKAIGPQDVLVSLINNLKVQDRQMRICTTIAIAVVAETCGPFTVLPTLMNEYRMPLNHVQNGVLKTLSFMFEYIGEMAKDYIYAITPLLEHALVSKDLVHKQIACNTLKHIALDVLGYGCEDALIHLFNFVFPNIFENSPHIQNGVFESFEALRLTVGPGQMLLYIIQGLYHPARRVRDVYWAFYNNLYVGAQDAMTPYYPNLQDDIENDINYEFEESIYYNI